MKLNFSRRHANLEGREEKSALQKLIDEAREFGIEHFLKGLSREQLLAIVPDPKTTPEGSRGLHLVEPHSKNPAVVKFSNGSAHYDYDKLPEDSLTRKIFDAGLEKGLFKFQTIYKPDGSTFRRVDMFPEQTAARTLANARALAGPAQ